MSKKTVSVSERSMAIGLIIASIAGLGLSGSVMNSENKQAEAQQEPQQRQTPTIEIPVSKGYVDGKVAYFIATDASDRQAVESIKNNTGHPINFAPILVFVGCFSKTKESVFILVIHQVNVFDSEFICRCFL